MCVREEIPENVIQQNRPAITNWLEEREGRGEETANMAQFVDFLTQKANVSREDAIRVSMTRVLGLVYLSLMFSGSRNVLHKTYLCVL